MLLESREAAKRLGLSTNRLTRMVRQGRFAGAYKDGVWLIPLKSVEDFSKLRRAGGYPRHRPRGPWKVVDGRRVYVNKGE